MDFELVSLIRIFMLDSRTHDCMTRERRGQEFAVKVFLESNEKDYNKNTSFRLQGRENIES